MDKTLSFEEFCKDVKEDYRLACLSRQLSIMGRKEVLTGKAKFGIFGDGKEIAQIALARFFKNGDWRSGYYRDQTFMLAAGLLTPEQFFALLYGDTDIRNNPHNGGRSFNNHFSTPNQDSKGKYLALTAQKNSSADISPTAGQMPRLLGLALASKLYRNNPELKKETKFTIDGNEVAFGTIGDASTSEGHFWETMNAASVLQVPMAVAVWDDNYGISVPKKYQTTKQSISEALKGFEKDAKGGIYIYKVKGWDYAALVKTFEEGIEKCRNEHIPVLFHVDELTQPQGHSTSGSHERYKDSERMKFEEEFDGIQKMRQWMLEKSIATEAELAEAEQWATDRTKEARNRAWADFSDPMRRERDELLRIIDNRSCICRNEEIDKISIISDELKKIVNPIRKDIFSAAKKILRHVCLDCPTRVKLQADLHLWLERNYQDATSRYSSKLYSETPYSALKVNTVQPEFSGDMVPGREILRDNWDFLMKTYPELVIFGEDVGFLGGVNQSYEGLQKKYGEIRIFDTGIRENTIMGQGIGMALRGLRPVVEIQYFDYLLYALQTMSDDLATQLFRTAGQQKAPVLITTRGHRLEGIWHSGSALSMVINAIRGIYLCVPRNMTQAAGFYNTILDSDDSAIVIEPLNGYRLKENKPTNTGQYKIPLGTPEIMLEGSDVTLVTYGSCVRIAEDAIKQLNEFNISVELIDVQTLLPFDIHHTILDSVKKTNKIIFFDEDVPGGATAYMMQKVIEEQQAWKYLDMEPVTLTAREHRPAYGTDGDYFSNPNAENVFEKVYDMMHRYNPTKHPQLY
ncbi:MAG: transketolase [Bacteroidetes bacterium HGW-Bacteroidetes-21]|jgi:pyruvate/2-oxoglutarate/acetoin dehydrogenase E1 component/TPP-dependent pyruvate/acetoin dehydrogenase alpha subunit|nr:MAG: transketolase [Bacteroidetes bacterium HGW-Bacteroidetes-21]